MKKFAAITLVILAVFSALIPKALATPAFDLNSVKADTILLIDVKSGKMLVQKNETAKIYPAGPTKLMTLLVALEKGGLNKTITVGSEINAFGTSSSKMGLITGEKITRQDLLYGMMLASGNDAAAALAVSYAGSITGFADLMNEKANALGMKDTHYVNSHGLQDPDQYTTADDISKLVLDGLKNTDWRKIICTPSYDLPKTNKTAAQVLYTSDLLINAQQQNRQYNYTNAEGGAAGKTNAGSCLVAIAKKGDTELLAIIYGDKSPNGTKRWTIAKSLFDFGFGSYSATDIAAAGNDTAASASGNSAGDNSASQSLSGDELANESPTNTNGPASVQLAADVKKFDNPQISLWWWLAIPVILTTVIVIRTMRLKQKHRSHFKNKRKVYSYRIR